MTDLRQASAWLELKGLINARIEDLRDDLERPGMPVELVRGEITGLRWVITQAEPDPKISEPTSTDYMQSSTPDPS